MNQGPTPRHELLRKEGLACLLALALLGLAALAYPLEPVGAAAQPGRAAAPWVFVGLQELLRVLPPLLGGLLLPAAALGLLAGLPWLGQGAGPGLPAWRWPGLAEGLGLLILLAWAVLTCLGLWRA